MKRLFHFTLILVTCTSLEMKTNHDLVILFSKKNSLNNHTKSHLKVAHIFTKSCIFFLKWQIEWWNFVVVVGSII